MANTWQNDDGLEVRFGGDHADESSRLAPRALNTMGAIKEIVLDYDLELLSDTQSVILPTWTTTVLVMVSIRVTPQFRPVRT